MLFRAESISKSFSDFCAVKEADFELETGRVTELTGRSGSGKSTLLNMLAGILTPTTGKILFDETDLYSLDEPVLSAFRNRHIGVIPQGQSGLKNLTVLENVLLPYYIFRESSGGESIRKRRADQKREMVQSDGTNEDEANAAENTPELKADSEKDAEARALELLELAGIANLRDAWASELSGGEGRRMAIVRALLMKPELILADEPTGDLDAETTVEILKLLRRCAEEQGSTVLLVTHDPLAEEYADHLWRMDAGILKKER